MKTFSIKLPAISLIFSGVLLWANLCVEAQPFEQHDIESVSGLMPIMIKSGDWNHDGYPDLILLHKDDVFHYIDWYPIINSQPSKQHQTLYKIESRLSDIVTFDIANLDDNAAPEIILMAEAVTVLYNDGNGTVSSIKKVPFNGNLITRTDITSLEDNYPVNPDHTILTLTDVDQDGDQDVLANQSGYQFDVQIVWYENIQGELQLKAWTLSGLGDSESQIHELIKAGDINKDGKQDLFTALFTVRGNDKEDVILNVHNNIMHTNQHYKFDDIRGFKDGVLADLNNDGLPDILGVSADEPNQIFWYKNTPNRHRNFSAKRNVIDTPLRPHIVSAADLDNDGDQDIMYASENTHTLVWYENLGNEKFSVAKPMTTTATGVKSMSIEDFDGDGDEDIAFAGYDALNNGEVIAWIENKMLYVSSISTTSGTGGNLVTLTGMNFSKSLQENTVKMGETAVTVASVSKNGKELSFVVPASLSQDTYPLTVSTGGQSVTLVDPFTVQQSLSSFSPASGTGNASLVLTGTNFYTSPEENKVQLDRVPLAVSQVNAENTALQATISASLGAGIYEVSVNGQSFPDRPAFTILPSLLSITPEAGKAGTSVMITGTNFGIDKRNITVQIGNTTTDIVSLNTEGSLIEATVPDLPAGEYVVSITVNGQTGKSTQQFSVLGEDIKLPQPAIVSITPIEGKPGELLTINGENFGMVKAVVSILFDDTPATVISVKVTEITAFIPNLPAGNYQITINVGDKTAAFKQAFIMLENTSPSPVVSAIHPPEAEAGEIVTLKGKHFGDDKELLTISINNRIANVSSVNDSTIIFIMPSIVPGTYEVMVTINDKRVTSVPTVNVIPEPVVDNTPPTLRFTFPNRYAVGSGDHTLQVQAKDASGIAKARFSLLQITEDAQKIPWRTKPIAQNDDIYSVTLSPPDFDELGLQYQFSFEDSAGNTTVTGVYYTYLQYLPNATQQIKMLGISPVRNQANPTIHDYHLIALPFESQPVHSVFEELGPQDDRSWKLFHYEEKQVATGPDREVYLKYPATFSGFEPGKGYFFIYNKDTSLQIAGNVMEANIYKSFEIRLAPGYNLVGNPYPYAINWNTVAAFNPHVSDMNLKTYHGKNGYENDQILEAFEGGFVLNPSLKEVLLKIPVTAKQAVGGRYTAGGDDKLEGLNWKMSLQLQTQHMDYHLGGIGMHEDATESIDVFDDFAPPQFLDYLEISFVHPEFHLARVTRDVVPVQDSYTWEFQVNTSLYGQEITMLWDNHRLIHIDDERQLILHDLQHLQLIDMRNNNSYTFNATTGTRDFKIYYGDFETIYGDLLSQEFTMGNPYPNPTSDEVHIPLVLPNTNQKYQIHLEIYNAAGGRVYATVYNALLPGYHILQWNRNAMNAGLYIYRIHIEELGLVREGRIAVQ